MLSARKQENIEAVERPQRSNGCIASVSKSVEKLDADEVLKHNRELIISKRVETSEIPSDERRRPSK